MFALALSLPILLQLTFTASSYALKCYSCTYTTDVNECSTVTECRPGQLCYSDLSACTLGCTENLASRNKQCGVIGAGGTLIGRDLMERQSFIPSGCHECCNTDKCK